jgi:PadR family transcriptional regulator, regulatory protein PadR
MSEKTDVRQGTLALMALKTLEAMGPLHGYGIARRQEGYIASEWGASHNNRKAKYYNLTNAGRKRLAKEARKWETTTAILVCFFTAPEES